MRKNRWRRDSETGSMDRMIYFMSGICPAPHSHLSLELLTSFDRFPLLPSFPSVLPVRSDEDHAQPAAEGLIFLCKELHLQTHSLPDLSHFFARSLLNKVSHPHKFMASWKCKSLFKILRCSELDAMKIRRGKV